LFTGDRREGLLNVTLNKNVACTTCSSWTVLEVKGQRSRPHGCVMFSQETCHSVFSKSSAASIQLASGQKSSHGNSAQTVVEHPKTFSNLQLLLVNRIMKYQ